MALYVLKNIQLSHSPLLKNSKHPLHSADFKPPKGLGNAHVQSLLATLKFRRKSLLKKSKILLANSVEWIIDCQDGVRLLSEYSAHPDSNGRLVILIHGWEGSSNSLYILSAAQKLYSQGYDVLRLNLRDHGDSHHLNQELFHSCRLDEVLGAVKAAQKRFQPKKLFLCGFSLGGNFALRVSQQASQRDIKISKTVAICPAINPIDILIQLENGLSFYNRYFLYKWKRSLKKKEALFPTEYDFSDVLNMSSMREMTESLIEQFGDFEHINAYFNGYALLGNYFDRLATPCSLLMSEDDPIINIADIELIDPQPNLQIFHSQHGGHCGYLKNYQFESWADDFILQQLK